MRFIEHVSQSTPEPNSIRALSLAEAQGRQRDTRCIVGRNKRKHHSANTSCPFGAEVKLGRVLWI